jgi:hypothetical protein
MGRQVGRGRHAGSQIEACFKRRRVLLFRLPSFFEQPDPQQHLAEAAEQLQREEDGKQRQWRLRKI